MNSSADELHDLDVMHGKEKKKKKKKAGLHGRGNGFPAFLSVLLEHGPGELSQGWPAKQQLVGVPTTGGVDIDGLWCGLEP